MSNMIVYLIILPLYIEELVINERYKRLKDVMDSAKENYEIIFVNDGSKYKTRYKVESICRNDKKIKLINFSRNFGHQAAITAGMDFALGRATIVIDADLQDPPEIIPEMIKKWKEGYEVAHGKRIKREGEIFFKKFMAKVFYRLLKSMASIDIPVDTGDFRLIDRKVCDVLISLGEKNRYVRGLVSVEQFKQLVNSGAIRYAIVSGAAERGGFMGGNSNSDITNWIKQKGKVVTSRMLLLQIIKD